MGNEAVNGRLVKSQETKKIVVIPPDENRVKFGVAQAVPSSSRAKSLPPTTWRILALLILVSVLLHVGSMANLAWLGQRLRGTDMVMNKQQPLRVTIKSVKTKTKEEEDDELVRRLLESKLTQTEKPKIATRLGHQDHTTNRETKVATKPTNSKGAEAGAPGMTTARPKETGKPDPDKNKSKTPILKMPTNGALVFGKSNDRKPRNAYESMLPIGNADLPGQMHAGYQDYIDENVDVGDRIDLNTTNYRYIGYFSSIRKAIELVWVYPGEAVRRGMEGEVKIEFRIEKDGNVSRVRIIRTSGFEVLDKATVETLKLASPLTPLPKGLGKERLLVTAAFRYVLYGSAGGH